MLCLAMCPSEAGPVTRQSIACTRTFGKTSTTYPDVLRAVVAFTSQAAEKLRRQEAAVHILPVLINKDRFGTAPPPYSFSTTLHLPLATSDTAELIRYARTVLKTCSDPICNTRRRVSSSLGRKQPGNNNSACWSPTPKPTSEQR